MIIRLLNKYSGLSADYGAYSGPISFFSALYVLTTFGFSSVPGISRVAIVSALCITALLAIRSRQLIFPGWPLYFLMFYAFLILPALGLDNPPWDLLGSLLTVTLGAVGVGLALHNDLVNYKILIYCMIVGCIINVVAISLGIGSSPFFEGPSMGGRYTGLLGNANTLGVRFSLTALLIWLLPQTFSNSVRFAGLLIMIYGVILSGSRKALVMAILFLIMILVEFLVVKATPKKTFISVLLFCLFIGVILFWDFSGMEFNGGLAELNDRLRVQQVLQGEGEASFNIRTTLIDAGVRIWQESPIFGSGLNQFAELTGFGSYSHNNYVELLVSGGIVALFLYYSLYVLIIINAMKLPKIILFRICIIVVSFILVDMASVTFSDKAMMMILAILIVISSNGQKLYYYRE